MRSSTPASGHAEQRTFQSCVRSGVSMLTERTSRAQEGRRQEKNSERCNRRFHASECHLRA
eukprot:2412168-Prymnesium_polylepis.1